MANFVMRNGLLPGLLFLSGAAAWETMAVAPLDVFKHSGYHHHSPSCSSTVRPGEWSPDPSTFFFPHTGGHGHSWDLCKDGYHCSPHDAIGKAYFTFKDGQFVVELVNNYGFPFEDVKVHIQTGHPPHSKSPKYSLKNGYCRAGDYHHGHYYPHHSGRHHGPVKCHVPYHEMLHDGPHKNVCPLEGKGSWILYIQIEAVISGHWGHEKIKVYNRGIKDDIRHSVSCQETDHVQGIQASAQGAQGGRLQGRRAHRLRNRPPLAAPVRAWLEVAPRDVPRTQRTLSPCFLRGAGGVHQRRSGDRPQGVCRLPDRADQRRRRGRDSGIGAHQERGTQVRDHRGEDLCGQNVLVRESGVRDALLSIDDEFQCSGDYFIAVFVRVCVADKVNTCGYHRIR